MRPLSIVQRSKFWLLSIVFIGPVLGEGTLEAATIAAATCSKSDVSSALSSASSGDTVVVPPGTCIWTSRLDIPSKALTLQGAGIDQTIIIDGTTYPSSTNGLLAWNTVSTGLHRITGFTFNGNASMPADPNNAGMMNFGGTSHSFRFDNNKVITERTSAGRISGFIWGVLDHNMFLLHNFKFGFYVFHGAWNGVTNGCSMPCADGSYAAPSNFGTSQFIFFEDNLFTADGTSHVYYGDGWAGARFVYRFNRTIDVTLDAHGTESAARARGTRAFEFYGNTISYPKFQSPSTFGTRSGTGLVFNNTATYSGSGYLTRVFDMVNYRSNSTCTICPPPFNLCNGSNGWDQNVSNGYACLDQVGRGQGNLIASGDNPSPVWPNQALEPVYAWGNTINGGDSPAVSATPTVIQVNRDFYNYTASFNGTAGVGVGPRGSRPSSCTAGVAYWSTDQGNWNSKTSSPSGVLDKCTSANNWTNAWYTPYTYPHPLTTGGATNPPPSPPANLTVR